MILAQPGTASYHFRNLLKKKCIVLTVDATAIAVNPSYCCWHISYSHSYYHCYYYYNYSKLHQTSKRLILLRKYATNQLKQTSDDDIFLICWGKFLNVNAAITMVAIITIIAATVQPMPTTRCSAGDY